MATPPASVDIRRAGDRYRTSTGWLTTAHSFSVGPHYDPANTSFGLLVLHDEHLLAPGAGFEPHRHRGLEVVTWVLEGALRHEDPTGPAGVLLPGQVQRLRAGTGVVHSERNGRDDGPLRFVQAWLLPDDDALPALHGQREVEDELSSGELVPVASGLDDDAPVRLGCPAALHVARIAPGRAVDLPDAPWLHLFVAAGDVALQDAGALSAGDAARLAAAGPRRVTATTPAELLVWEMRASPGR